MSKKIGFLQRWMFIIDKINSHPYISKEELELAVANELGLYDGTSEIGIKTRTIERDISEIRNSPYMDISIEYCRRNKGYYIPCNEKSLSKLDRLFELSSLLTFSSLKDIVFPDNRKHRGLEHRFRLISAIRNSVEIEIDYRKYTPSSNSQTYRRLCPYALREFKNRWYLLAKETDNTNEENRKIKAWGLDRIGKLSITNRKFRKDPELDIKKKFEHCFGIYTNEELQPERVILSFSALSGKYNDALPLHESQKVLIHNENEFRIELTVKLTTDFIMELLSQSMGMSVIEPAGLRQQLIDIHREAVSLLEINNN